jgi:hypothetical protein
LGKTVFNLPKCKKYGIVNKNTMDNPPQPPTYIAPPPPPIKKVNYKALFYYYLHRLMHYIVRYRMPIGIGIILLFFSVSGIWAVNFIKNKYQTSETPLEILPVDLRPDSALKPEASSTVPTIPIYTNSRPTQKPKATSYYRSPTTAPNEPTAVPTQPPAQGTEPTNPPPTRTPNPPVVTIGYPTDGQWIILNPTEGFCLTETPSGGDVSGLQRKYQNNNDNWSAYQSFGQLCYEPSAGSNTLSVSYRNSYGDESAIQTIQFNFSRTVPCTDSDGGRVYNVYGTALGGTKPTCPQGGCDQYCPAGRCQDTCLADPTSKTIQSSGTYLLEWFCDNGHITYEMRLCDFPGCKNGVCVSAFVN